MNDNDLFVMKVIEKRNGLKKIRKFFKRNLTKNKLNATEKDENSSLSKIDKSIELNENLETKNEIVSHNQPIVHDVLIQNTNLNLLTFLIIIKKCSLSQCYKTLYYALKMSQSYIHETSYINLLKMLFGKKDIAHSGLFIHLMEKMFIMSKKSIIRKYLIKILKIICQMPELITNVLRIALFCNFKILICSIAKTYKIDIGQECIDNLCWINQNIIVQCEMKSIIRLLFKIYNDDCTEKCCICLEQIIKNISTRKLRTIHQFFTSFLEKNHKKLNISTETSDIMQEMNLNTNNNAHDKFIITQNDISTLSDILPTFDTEKNENMNKDQNTDISNQTQIIFNIHALITMFFQNSENSRNQLTKKYLINLLHELQKYNQLNSVKQKKRKFESLKIYSPNKSSIYHFIYRLYKTIKLQKDKISAYYYLNDLFHDYYNYYADKNNENSITKKFDQKTKCINFIEIPDKFFNLYDFEYNNKVLFDDLIISIIKKISDLSLKKLEKYLQTIRIDNLRIKCDDFKIKQCLFITLNVNITRKEKNLSIYEDKQKYDKKMKKHYLIHPLPPKVILSNKIPYKLLLNMEYNQNIMEYNLYQNQILIRSNYLGKKLKMNLKLGEKVIAKKNIYINIQTSPHNLIHELKTDKFL